MMTYEHLMKTDMTGLDETQIMKAIDGLFTLALKPDLFNHVQHSELMKRIIKACIANRYKTAFSELLTVYPIVTAKYQKEFEQATKE